MPPKNTLSSLDNFYNPGADGHKGDRSFYIPDVEYVLQSDAQGETQSRQDSKKPSWHDLDSSDYLAHLSMAVEEKMVPVAADPDFYMAEPHEDEHTVPQNTSKTSAFVWKGGKPNFLDHLGDAARLEVPVRRTDLDEVRKFWRQKDGTISEVPPSSQESLAPSSPEVHRPIQEDYGASHMAEDLRKIAGARDPRIIDGKSLIAGDLLKEGEESDDDKRFEDLYHSILETEFTDPSGGRLNKNEVIHMIEQVRESLRRGNLAQAEMFLSRVPVAAGIQGRARKLTRIHEHQIAHARGTLHDAYDKGSPGKK